MNTVEILDDIPRDASMIACTCKGAADLVNPTDEEIRDHGCGRSWGCCTRVFVCRLCGNRLVGKAESPEAD